MRRRTRSLCALSALAGITIFTSHATAQPAADWSMIKGNAQGTSRTDTIGPTANPTIKWQADLWYASGPTLGPGGQVHLGAGGITRLDAATGQQLWRYDFPGTESTYITPPVSIDGTTYGAQSRDVTHLYAVDAAGQLDWSHPLGTGTSRRLYASPRIDDRGRIFVPVTYDGIYAFTPSGQVLWHLSRSGDYYISSPALSPDMNKLYVADDSASLRALDTSTGKTLWVVSPGYGFRSSPAVGKDGTIYIGSDDNTLDAYAPDGRLTWQFEAEGDAPYQRVFSSPALASDGTIIFTNEAGFLYALNPDGSLRWKLANDHFATQSAVIDGNDQIYITGHEHTYSFNLEGTQLWSLPIGGYATAIPALGNDGTLYIAQSEAIYAIIPEPATGLAMLVGVMGVVVRRRK